MNTHAITDEDLVAYLDGEVEPERRKVINAQLATDPNLRARLDELSIDTDQLRDAFDTLLAHAPNASEATKVTNAGHLRRFWPPMAAACVAGALLVGTLGVFSPAKHSDWQTYVATYQALYVGETLTHLQPTTDQQLAELTYVGNAIGKDFTLGALSETAGLKYKRAQILGFEGRPLIQFAFLSKAGAPVALCMIRSDESSEKNVSITEMEGMSTASWSRKGFEYMLIGGTDDDIVEAAARKLAAVL